MQKLLTIVVPMYNVEKYVRKCLGSFVMPDKEKMNSLEVLCINDGSPDHSSEIAKQFQANYPATYRVIDKTNGNYGSCINRGLAEAKGLYFKVCDGDKLFAKIADYAKNMNDDFFFQFIMNDSSSRYFYRGQLSHRSIYLLNRIKDPLLRIYFKMRS